MNDVIALEEYHSYMIFFDLYTHKFYTWNNGRKMTSVDKDKLKHRINKLCYKEFGVTYKD